MKKPILLTISLMIAMSTMIATTTFANGETCTPNQKCSKANEICDNGKCKDRIEVLTQIQTPKDNNTAQSTANVQNLPKVTLQQTGSTIIKTLLGWSMLFTIVAIIVAAIYYLVAQGKEENVSKAKSIILYLVIGLAIMAGAYGIVAGITQFNFFDTN